MSGDILFLAHRLPFPPDRGDKIRSHHILRYLAGLAPVHVGCLADVGDLAHVNELARVAASWRVERRCLPLPVAGLMALARGEPVSVTAFRNERLAQFVRETIARHDIKTIYVFSGQMGQYVPDDFAGRLIVDLGDVDSAKFEAYSREGSLPMRWVHSREGRLLREEERRLAARADFTLFVSDAEAAFFLSRLGPGVAASVRPVANGIDFLYFDPARASVQPDMSSTPGPHIVFTGQMDYPPNIAAAKRIMLQLMPLIRVRHPAAQCHIVGRNPPEALRALGGRNGCRVWGEVPDVRPFLASADVVLVPLEIARGVQNKVLEAMSMARPVVLSGAAATGISARHEKHFLIGETDTELAVHATALLSDKARAEELANAGRQFVVEHYDWASTLSPLEEMIATGVSDQDRVAA